MARLLKKLLKLIVNSLGLDIINLKRSPNSYFYKPREIFFHPALQKVRGTIYNDCPSPMYRETYHIHQIGSWGPLPSIISLFYELKNKSKEQLESLDIGCAFGTMAAFCSELGYRSSAIDFVPKETYLGEKTRKTYNIDFRQISIETEPLPWAEKKFDIITMTEVLEHFYYQPIDTLNRLKSILKDDGLLLITTPALGQHWAPEHYNHSFEKIPSYHGGTPNTADRHWKIYDSTELDQLLNKAGFKTITALHLNINTGKEGLSTIAMKKNDL